MTFKHYIEQLSDEELFEIAKKIFAGEAERFISVLQPVRTQDLALQLFLEIDQLPVILIQKILKFKETILQAEWHHPSAKLDTIVNNIIRLSVKYNSEVLAGTLLQGIEHNITSNAIKLKLAIHLSRQNFIVKELLEQATANFAFLFPALINRVKYTHPIEGLEVLDRHIHLIDEKNRIMVRSALRALLLNLLSLEPFHTDCYESYLYTIDACQPETITFIQEVLALPEFKGISEKLKSFETELIETRIVKVFTPRELNKAKELVIKYTVGHHFTRDDMFTYNLNAVCFNLIEGLQSQHRQPELFGKLFFEFDAMYKKRFHLYLEKFGASYDPIDHAASIGDQLYPFSMDLATFMQSTAELRNRFKGGRTASVKRLIDDVL